MVQDEAQSRLALPAVVVGVLAVGASAIFIRLADAPALAIAFWRCALGVAVLVPVAVARRERLPERRAVWVGVLSGLALGAHFGVWISSLEYTSVAASVVLVCTTPVFVAIFGYLALGEKTSFVSFAGIIVAIAGSALIAGSGASYGGGAFFGNALALAGAITVAVYVLIGRSLRTGGMGVLSYSIIGYSAAAVTLLAVVIPTGTLMWGYSWETWFWLWTITLGPQILGHTLLNWSLEYVKASLVSGSVLAEPVIAAFLAWLVLSEEPGVVTILGGVVVLAGLFLLLRGNR